MRNSAIIIVALGASALLGAACGGSETPVGTTANVGVTVAPLDLPLMSDVCYGLSVFGTDDIEDMNATSVVWTQPNLCASDYGAEGGIRFTGTCDAQAGGFDDTGAPLDPDHNNTVMLVLNDVYTGGDWDGDGVALMPGRDYINPCPAVEEGQDNGCILVVPCTANADEKVLFNLTIMRDAQLGFFDTVVKFQDVFCAAKLDCVDDDNQTLTYLNDPTASPPADGPTVVLGFACLGDDNATISMYLDDLVVTCTDGVTTRTATVDPAGGPGNLSAPALSQSGAPDVLFAAAVNTGEGFQGAQYWNVMLGLNLPGSADENCTLHTTGTVSETSLSAYTTPALTRYPYIDWTIDLTRDGERVCTRHPLNGEDGGVETRYTPIDAPETFDHTLDFGLMCPCWDAAALASRLQEIVDSGVPFQSDQGDLDDEEGTYSVVQLWSDNEQDRLLLGAGTLNYGIEGVGTPGPFCYIGRLDAGIESVSWQQPISEAAAAVCLADLVAIFDDPCRANNGGCAGGTCIYDGPAQFHCLECTSDAQCPGERCDMDTNTCVGCLSDADCTSPLVCNTETQACIEPPCVPGVNPWTATTALPVARTVFALATYNGYVYISGGDSGGGALDDVQYAPIDPSDGTLGAWTSAGSFGAARQGHTMVAQDGYLFILGGNSLATHDMTDTRVAQIQTNGSLGPWMQQAPLVVGRFYHTSVVHNGFVYAIAGFAVNQVQMASIGGGFLGNWSYTAPAGPTSRWVHTSEVYNDFLYVIGGDSGPLSDVRMTTMNGDGTLGAWTSTQSMPTGRGFHASAVNNSTLYVLGGYVTGGVVTNDVLFAPINNGDGTLGSFNSSANRFAVPRYATRSFTLNGYLYILGGSEANGTPLDSVQMTTFSTCP